MSSNVQPPPRRNVAKPHVTMYRETTPEEKTDETEIVESLKKMLAPLEMGRPVKSDRHKELDEAYAHDAEEMDRILAESITNERPLTPSELAYASRFLNWDADKVRSERVRMSSVLRLQNVVGTTDDREQLDKAVEAARSDLATRGPKIQDQIDKLAKELEKLQSDADRLDRKQDEVKIAIDQLQRRDMLPTHKRNEHTEEDRYFCEYVRGPLHALTNHISYLEIILAGPVGHDANSKLDYFTTLRLNCHAAVSARDAEGLRTYDYSPEWPAIRRRMEIELKQAQELLPQVEAKVKEAEAVPANVTTYYLR